MHARRRKDDDAGVHDTDQSVRRRPHKAKSTVVPLSQENGLGLWKAIMAQPNFIQAVLVIEDMPKALITLIPENMG